MADVQKLIEHFDHQSPAFAEDPWSVYTVLRQQCPVLHSEAQGGFWVFSRYEDVVAISQDDATFCSGQGILVGRPNGGNIPIEMDPPEFFKYRKPLNPLFSPLRAKRLEPAIRALATELIDEFIEDGRCDIHQALARPLPAILTFRLLGFPTEQGEWRDYLDAIEYGPGETGPGQSPRGSSRFITKLGEVVTGTVDARRREPKDDWISFLAHMEVEGRQLTDEELRGMVQLILAGGLLTTTDAIGNALIYLEQDREARRRLIEGPPELWDTAIEEFLRYEAPTTALRRTVTRDCEVAGQKLKAGESVLIIWASANRDEAEFPDADKFVIDRHPNRHVTFGVGIHRCLGSNIARVDFRVALEEVLRRMPDYRIDLDSVVPSEDVGIVYGRRAIPMTFTPGRREATGEHAAPSRGR